MSKVYPVRPYTSTAEVAVGDVVRMRHPGDLHGGISPSFDDSIIAEIRVEESMRVATLRRPHIYVKTDGEIFTRVETLDVELYLLVQRFDVCTTGPRGEKESRIKYQLWETGYYTVLIPWSDKPTRWHPTEKTGPFAVLSRGSFSCESEAADWAREILEGQPFTVKRIPGVYGVDPSVTRPAE